MTRYRAPREVVTRPIEGGLAVLNLSTGECYELNEVGARVWALLSEGQTVEEVAGTVSGEYDVAVDVALQDVGAVIGQLTAQRLLEGADAAP